ncbi:MAG: acyltransferase [Clostridia bacterium]|nr:acyltransferase [Clostridia bacterium]
MKKFLSKFFGTNPIDTSHIGVLDGIRALSIVFVCGFHFWQQSWLWYLQKDQPFGFFANLLKGIGVDDVNLNWLYQYGYVFVDMMILLTGLCLFLPHANAMLDKGKLPLVGKFYLKRVARIFPSYFFHLAILLIFFVSVDSYGGNAGSYLKDVVTHFTFTQMFWPETYVHTKLNPVLWTLTVEMIFYIIFPFLAWLFKKAPLATYLGMNAVSLVWYIVVIKNPEIDMSLHVNQFPTFLCVFANGMMAALLIAALARNLRQNKYTGLFFTGLAILSIYVLRLLIKYGLGTYDKNKQFWQVQNRFLLSVIFAAIIIGATFSFNWFRAIFSNPAARFFSTISFNLFIWHQYICLKLKEWHIPPYVSESGMPQKDAGREWQWLYTIVCWIISILFATLVTYLVEKPMHSLILGKYRKNKPAVNNKNSGGKLPPPEAESSETFPEDNGDTALVKTVSKHSGSGTGPAKKKKKKK